MCSRRKVDDLEEQLQSSKALVADLQKTLQERDSELETLRLKVCGITTPNHSEKTFPCMMNAPT